MAHSMENSVTPAKRRNSTVYVAKTATGDNSTSLLRIGIQNERSTGERVADVANGELPRRDSVLQIKNAFEKVVKPTGIFTHRDSVSGKLREILINNKVEDFSKISTTRDNSQCVQGNYCSALQSHSVKSANSKSQISCDTVKPEARFEAEEQAAIGLVATNSAHQPDSQTSRPGSLLLQPASNIRGSLAKAEYLGLNKFNDVKTYACSKKRSKMTVDELDKRLEASSPVTNIDYVTDAACGYEDELQGQEFDKEFACEFVGAGVKGNRPVLKRSKSSVNKKVSFCLRSTSVFEYPADEAETGSSPPPAELNDASESLNHSESEPDGERLNIVSKSLQSSPVCSATGKLGSYQSRLLEHVDLSPCYSTASSSTSSLLSQEQQRQYFEMTNLRQRVSMVTSCSADEPSRPWSDGNSGTELLF